MRGAGVCVLALSRCLVGCMWFSMLVNSRESGMLFPIRGNLLDKTGFKGLE